MLSLAGGETESSGSAPWKFDADLKTWRDEQAREQRQIARHRLDAAISDLCGSDGEEHLGKLSIEGDFLPRRSEAKAGRLPLQSLIA